MRRCEDVGLAKGQVILTFDDGPAGEGKTETLLDLLARHRIRAGFCVVGREVERRPDLCRRIHAEGHLLVNHSFDHVSPLSLTEAELTADIERCDAAIGRAIGNVEYRSRWFRPPGGIVNLGVERVLTRTARNLYPITFFAWDVFPIPGNCWRIGSAIRDNLRRNRAGMYILHEWIYPISATPTAPGNCPWLIPVVEEIIATVRREGAEFVAPDQILAKDFGH